MKVTWESGSFARLVQVGGVRIVSSYLATGQFEVLVSSDSLIKPFSVVLIRGEFPCYP
jgi:hypothetical protein